MLGTMNATNKNAILQKVKDSVADSSAAILEANAVDVQNARLAKTKESLIDRLSLTHARLEAILQSVDDVINQQDPIGEIVAGWRTKTGLLIRQVRVPFGVVAVIYESRPNVTLDTFALCFKSGNAVLLRGSSNAYNTNLAIVTAIKNALGGLGGCVELAKVKAGDHSDVMQILGAVGKIDLAIPRGSARLIKSVVENAKVPVIETGSGVCHLFVDKTANLEMAVAIAENAKIQRPGVCNAIEAILVHKDIAGEFLPRLAKKFGSKVVFHVDDFAYQCLKNGGCGGEKLIHATKDDEGHEYLDYECYVHSVADIDEAIDYINSHNTKHSEAIVTSDYDNARLFQSKIDAACVYVNASTRFTDGGEFGFGCELGISTQKLHARGPMGLSALTTTKYLIDGSGQIRE